jgi:hypothetical protein
MQTTKQKRESNWEMEIQIFRWFLSLLYTKSTKEKSMK